MSKALRCHVLLPAFFLCRQPPVAANDASSYAWFKWIAALAVLGVPFVLLIPAVLITREDARRAGCISKLKQVGMGAHNYYEAHGRFPATQWDHTNGFGWSWLVYLLPYMEQGELFDRLNVREDPPTGDAAMTARPNAYVCPSYAGPAFVEDGRGGIANYKAMGATTKASLAFYDTTVKAKAPYGTADRHPDGAFPPGRPLHMRDFSDGLSNTIFATETIEEKAAVWQDGSTATLAGFPNTVNVHLVEAIGPNYVQWPGRYHFTHFANYVPGEYEAESKVDPAVRPYLSWDYTGADGPYEGVNYVCGASSSHPGVVNHLFGDGSVQSVSTGVDPSVYWFKITRSGGDPVRPSPGHY